MLIIALLFHSYKEHRYAMILRVSYITISFIMTSFAADVSSASLFGSVQDPPLLQLVPS